MSRITEEMFEALAREMNKLCTDMQNVLPDDLPKLMVRLKELTARGDELIEQRRLERQ
ncbi:MAG TPA: hypothetical protein VGN72_00160 [Tepidisphaeraceae bacterium]|nr:hypothetical protein [Tepidisphaeraceae bacterium]